MLVGPDGTAVGSVSGGCVEGAVYELRRGGRDDGTAVLQRYGVSDDDAFAVGLTCGGIIDIFVEPVNRETVPRARRGRRRHPGRPAGRGGHRGRRRGRRGVGRRLVVRPGPVSGTLGSHRLDDAVRDDARGLLAQGRTGTVHYGPRRRAARRRPRRLRGLATPRVRG